MTSQWLYRLTLVAPAALQSNLNAWITANLDPTGGPWLTNGLSANGSSPATYYWFNAALTLAQLTTIAQQICSMTGLTLPADWATETFAEQHTWFLNNTAAMKSAAGIYTVLDDNTGTWTDPQTVLNTLSLQVINPGS